MIRSIHPFPAKMAPELAISYLKTLTKNSIILDPMVGSGTVIKEAITLGHKAIGFDLDPLSVLITKVSTSSTDLERVVTVGNNIIKRARSNKKDVFIPWIDEDTQTTEFVNFWYGKLQIKQLRILSYFINKYEFKEPANLINILKIALSRIIICKNNGASLARDISHSRPHKVKDISNFDVISAFEKSLIQLCKILEHNHFSGRAKITKGDARNLKLKNESIDTIITSPPYLNAIDYMRGHKLALVWLGYKLSELKNIRSYSIGTERAPETKNDNLDYKSIKKSMGKVEYLPIRQQLMIERYIIDIHSLLKECYRVLCPSGSAIFVIGNSCLKNVYIKNSSAIKTISEFIGFKLEQDKERTIPVANRYLPLPSKNSNALGKRMRTEHVLHLIK